MGSHGMARVAKCISIRRGRHHAQHRAPANIAMITTISGATTIIRTGNFRGTAEGN